MNYQRQLLYQTTKDKFLHAQKTNTMALPTVMVFIFCNLQESLVSPGEIRVCCADLFLILISALL